MGIQYFDINSYTLHCIIYNLFDLFLSLFYVKFKIKYRNEAISKFQCLIHNISIHNVSKILAYTRKKMKCDKDEIVYISRSFLLLPNNNKSIFAICIGNINNVL